MNANADSLVPSERNEIDVRAAKSACIYLTRCLENAALAVISLGGRS